MLWTKNRDTKVSALFRGEPKKIAYLRTDYHFGVKSGGSVGHIAGVANGFVALGYKLFLISSDRLALINEQITPLYCVRPTVKLRNLPALPELYYNQTLIQAARRIFDHENPSFIYQRYSYNNYTGAWLAREYRIPLILEYNGSEIWVARHWGRRLVFKGMTERIELTNLHCADLVVVVSQALKDELITRGIDPEKILVNPNGVDPERYRPDLDGREIRHQYGLDHKLVIGFIGTFGRWHGAEILAQAIRPVIEKIPEAHFLFVGDGLMMPQVQRIIQETKVRDKVTFTGIVPQARGPEYLGACDLLVSPHVPNPDGTPFFGSPTKLFEYMAMGKGIVASRLAQIAEVLQDERNALLVQPGKVDELVQSILRLATDRELRDRLGLQARQDVITNYTWEKNVAQVVQKCQGLVSRWEKD